ncbi:glycosyl transferase family 2 [Pseudofrankia inefficax]|uniref:Glycosyl transferase family 2 n=1 Tax=Pseudofrankia inefficax (strain DSM 45817 / CECT 9037 / DDB 130130 / EuI1c) TaxID=298654 RepID=E3IYT5_PSEI1|nr:glycosyl transferase family 2 [Pseudofrankia inefficax]
MQCDPETTVLSRGKVLLGGSPLRLLTLSVAGGSVWEALLAGRPVGRAGPGAGALARRLVDAGLAWPVPPAQPGGRMATVTAVLPVRDGAAGLGTLIAALARRCAEVIVVDDGSTDATGAVAAAAGARVLRHERPRGPAAARLTGAAAATTPLVLFCDADIQLPDELGAATGHAGWLGLLLGHLADPAVAAVAPRVASPVQVGARAGLLARYESARSPLDLGARPAAVRPGSRVSYVPTAVLLVRRELVGFDPALRYGEDVDLVWRLVAAGWSVRYEPAAVVHHRPRADWFGWARQRFGYGSSAGPLAVRHAGPLRPASPAALAGAGAVALAAAPAGAARRAVVGAVGVATAGRGVLTASRLSRRLAAAPRPGRLAWVMVLAGRRYAVEAAADNIRRGWWPLLASSRAGRRVFAAAVVIPAGRDWWITRPPVGLGPYVLVRMLDDAAYSAGVWWGCARARTARPLLPPGPPWAGRVAAALRPRRSTGARAGGQRG